MIEGASASDLVSQFGSPLFVISERTLRQNYRRIQAAFAGAWPGPVSVLYAIKSNNCLAVRAILSQEGAGGDCFGLAELQATLRSGADPACVVLNGSNKRLEELSLAARRGVTVTIDNEMEIDLLADLAAQLRRTIPVKLRLKIVPDGFKGQGSDYFGVRRDLAAYLAAEKWGVVPETAARLVKLLLAAKGLTFQGYQSHMGRVARTLQPFRWWARDLGRAVVQLHRRTGWMPRVVDIGGGWPRERDPESRSLSINRTPIERYAETVCAALLAPIRQAGLPAPDLWLEPGRYIVGNAALLLTSVGPIKNDAGRIWVNVDASTNLLMRIDTSGSRYHALPATGMRRPYVERGLLVGSTCIDSTISADFSIPAALRSGDVVAVLDAGMYAESASTQFNSLPRPATVLVSGTQVDLVKRRETVRDVFALHRIPDRLSASRSRRDRKKSSPAPHHIQRKQHADG